MKKKKKINKNENYIREFELTDYLFFFFFSLVKIGISLGITFGYICANTKRKYHFSIVPFGAIQTSPCYYSTFTGSRVALLLPFFFFFFLANHADFFFSLCGIRWLLED